MNLHQKYSFVAKWSFAIVLIFSSMRIFSQEIERQLDFSDVEAHLRFLASDELRGRKTGEMGNWVAARYIAEQFRRFGLQPGNAGDYFQIIPFGSVVPATKGTLKIGDQAYTMEDNLLVRFAPSGHLEGEVIFLPHAADDEISSDVKGKLVVAYLGVEGNNDPVVTLEMTVEKKKKLQEMGAVGIVEIYNGRHPWNLIKRYLGSGRMVVLNKEDNPDFPTFLLNDLSEETLMQLKEGKLISFTLDTDGTSIQENPSPNVVGVLEGSDPVLKNEYVALTAHFDHVGTYKAQDRPVTEKDSIFNGARDNAFGVSALLSAAGSLSVEVPKRSILFIAFTGEEIGLVGSKYFVSHPTIPLNQIVFNLNTDGAGNSDSTIVSVMGLDRVGASEEIKSACEAFGLGTFADPAPEQNLFDRSDNVSFAVKGIPAPTFSPGFKQFDNEILKHYHQPSDEVQTIDLQYVYKFCQAYSLAARLIANKSTRPKWINGDKYEPAFLELYGSNR